MSPDGPIWAHMGDLGCHPSCLWPRWAFVIVVVSCGRGGPLLLQPIVFVAEVGLCLLVLTLFLATEVEHSCSHLSCLCPGWAFDCRCSMWPRWAVFVALMGPPTCWPSPHENHCIPPPPVVTSARGGTHGRPAKDRKGTHVTQVRCERDAPSMPKAWNCLFNNHDIVFTV